MNKKTFALLTITFGFCFSLFLMVTFQHPLYVSKWVLLLSALAGFSLALLAYLFNVRRMQAKQLDTVKFNQLALVAFALSLAYIVLVGYKPNTLLTPAVKVQLTITPSTSASTPLTNLVAVSDGTHFFSLKQPEVTHSNSATYQDRKLIIQADTAQPASITFTGKSWASRIHFSFEPSTRDFMVDFFVNGQKSTYGYTTGQGDGTFITSVALPPAYTHQVLSFLSFFLSLFVSFFFLGLQVYLLREQKLPFLPTLIVTLQCLFILALVVYKFYQFSPKFYFPGIDSFLFNIYGKELLHGKIMYKDFWDHKGPLIFFINALGQSLNRGLWGTWLIGLLVPITTGLVLLKMFRKKLGILWPGLLIVFMWAYTARFEGGNHTEDYGLLLYMLAFYLYWLYLQHKRKTLLPFLIGLCAGGSFMLRANLISPFIAIGICLLLEGFAEKNWRAAFISIGLMALGVFSLIAVFVGYFISRGILINFFDAAFIYNFLYSQQTGLDFVSKISFVFKSFPLYMCIVVACLMVVIFLAFSRKDLFLTHEKYLLLLVCVGYGIELLIYNISGYNFFHYMVPLVPYETFILAFFGFLLLKYTQNTAFLKITNTLFYPVFLLMVFLGFSGGLYGLNFITPPSQSDIYQQLKSELNPGDQLVMWGFGADFQYMVDATSPFRYYDLFPLINCAYVNENKIQELISTISIAKPVIVDTRKMGTSYLLDAKMRGKYGYCTPFEALWKYFDNNYQLVNTLTNGMEVYRPAQP